MSITVHRLRELLVYDPLTGTFTRRRDGRPVGFNSNGYVMIHLEGTCYRAHRLAWLYTHGVWPTKDIDHIDLCRSNNRIANLREATRGENLRNTRPQRRNLTGLKGVRYDAPRKRYIAQVSMDGRTVFLGRFMNASDASAAYMAVASKNFAEFARAS